ncbi:carbon-nitrogen hydrolase family protein [Occultella aeris]|uniref:Carbon-nitrogen hydrolase n=1 Tax=Occultella aeris TaxID=2761496 RepID=A0A7M4DKB7_9MICO|nr:carbon-nitrogen hydrolase family protein [Occultella aeris]VZO37515.1 Carbon-nitrogen hydrolase [Occultella aeris]
MTIDRALKSKIRDRAARTGESYTAARRHLVRTDAGPGTSRAEQESDGPSVRVAVAQTRPREDPGDVAGFVAAGDEVVSLIDEAAGLGASLLHLPEAALCFPSKHLLSSVPGEVAEADWARFAWDAQAAALSRIRARAAERTIWVVVGAVTRSAADAGRPHLSLLVIDSAGRLHAKYDERLLSRTKAAFLYAAGTEPILFEVDGVRFGCTSGLEILFPEIYGDYQAIGADCVLYSTAGPGDPGADDTLTASALVAARHDGMWISYAVHSDKAPHEPSGLIDPNGTWRARCEAVDAPALTVATVTARPEDPARQWHRWTSHAYRTGRSDAQG